jgi:hypothetical protein
MTLVLTTANSACVVQTSDRLTTKWRRRQLLGEHDAVANKTIVYLAKDGPMVLSFAGVAYVGNEPTDDWIARRLAGAEPSRQLDGRIPSFSFGRLQIRTFHQACWLLQREIDAEPAFEAGLEVAIGGWRVRRHRLVQTVLAIVKTGRKTIREGHMRLRTKAFGGVFLKAGVDFDLTELNGLPADHPVWSTRPFDVAAFAAAISDDLANAIVKKSRSNPAVGSDVMAVEIPRWGPDGVRTIMIRFKPQVERRGYIQGSSALTRFSAAFWPWIVTPAGAQAPSLSTGGQSTLHMCGWEIILEAPAENNPLGLLYAHGSIKRPPPPG